MAYPDDLPQCVDGSLGRTKVNTASYTANAESADASEYNAIKSSVQGLALALGLPDGSTANSVFEALITRIPSGSLTNPTTYAANGSLVQTSSLWVPTVGGIYLGLPNDTVSTTRILSVPAGSIGLVPIGYPTTGTINGSTPGAIAGIDPGVYIISGDGTDTWGVISCAEGSASAVDLATLQTQVDDQEAEIARGSTSYEEYSGAGTMGAAAIHVITGTGYTLNLPGSLTGPVQWWLMLIGTGTVTIDGNGHTIDGLGTYSLVGNASAPTLVRFIYSTGNEWSTNLLASRAELPAAVLAALAATSSDVSFNSYKLTDVAEGAASTDGVNKGQMDTAIGAAINGQDPKASCRVASTANINLALPGATIDGVTMASGDRFLAKDQSVPSENGIYAWNGAATPATRTADADTSAEVNSGMSTRVSEGSTATNKATWTLITADPITLGVTSLTFQNISPQISSSTPNAIGTAAAGTTGLASDAGHIHAIPSDHVTLAMVNSAVKSAAQGTESLRQIATSGTTTIGTANAAGNDTKAAAGNHVHDHGSQTTTTHHAVATTSGAGFMSAAHAQQLFDLVSSADPLSAFPSYGTIKVTARYTDFETTSTGNYPYSAFGSGTGNANSWAASVAGRVGLITLDTGTTTTGFHYVGTNVTCIAFGSGAHRWRADLFVATASDGTDTFIVRQGFIDATSGECVDGAYFRGTHSVNGGRWECVTRANSVETATDSGIAMVSATCQSFEIQVNAAGSSVAFEINGALVQTHTTNIPTGIARATGVGCSITKSAGTTSRSVTMDLMGDRPERTAAI